MVYQQYTRPVRLQLSFRLGVSLFLLLILFPSIALPSVEAQERRNNDSANATVLTSFPFSQVVELSNITVEASEVNQPCSSGNSAWYQLTPTHDGTLSIAVASEGADVAPTIGLYTGTAHALAELACVDEIETDKTEVLKIITITAGKTYYVQAGVLKSTPKPIVVSINFISPAQALDCQAVECKYTYLPFIIKQPPVPTVTPTATKENTNDWLPQDSTVTTKLNGIDCPTTTFCVVVGDEGKLLTTSNGGSSWTVRDSGVTNNLNHANCIDDKTCVAVGHDGRIIRTTDGGNSWNKLNSSTGQHLRGVSCATTFCIAVGGIGDNTVLVFSNNSGQNWINPPVRFGNTILEGASCPNDGTCTVVGFYGRVIVFAGIGIKANHTLNEAIVLKDIACPSASNCLTVGTKGTVMKTSNAGGNWATRPSGVSATLEGVSCPDQQTCFAAGSDGLIINSSDSGDSWRSQKSGVTTSLNDINCPSLTTCYAVGDGGKILVRK